MPWSANDATRFKKDLKGSSRDRWAAIANKILQETGDEGKAIRIANGATRGAVDRRLKRKTGIGGFQ